MNASAAGEHHGGPGHSALWQYLERARAAPLVVVAHVDLCNCELLNLLCGAEVTRAFLAEFERVLQHVAGDNALAVHAWGDEFHVAFPLHDADAALGRMEQLREALKGLRAPAPMAGLPVLASFGAVVAPASHGGESLLQKAQLACREARRRGMNQIVLMREDDPFFLERHRRMTLGSRLLRLIAQRELSLHAQPIFFVEQGVAQRVAKVEILLRRDPGPDGDPLDASTVEVAERYGFMRAVDEYVLHQALAWMKAHPGVFERMERVSLNLSGRSLGDRGFHEHLVEAVRASGVDPRRICFEITETSLIGHLGELRGLLEALRAQGCTVALDDFGVGLCSFGYLRELPVDEIKIDGSFIRGMTRDPVARRIVHALKEVADATGKRTVAEFVEDPAALQALQELGVCYLQGWLFSRAMPLDELPAYLERFHAAPLRALPSSSSS